MKNNLERCLDVLHISRSDYYRIIDGLARVSTREMVSRPAKVDRHDWVGTNAVVERIFGNCTIRAEDRGPVYALWINATKDDGSLRRVLFFAEIPWNRGTSSELRSRLKKQIASSSTRHFGQSRRSA